MNQHYFYLIKYPPQLMGKNPILRKKQYESKIDTFSMKLEN